MRIVTLLPSATEIVCALGLREQLVGVTHECDEPADVIELPRVTHTLIPHDATSDQIDTLVRERLETEQALYSLNWPVLKELAPDVLVTQALCDVCAVAASEVHAAARELPSRPQVVNLEPMRLTEVWQCIRLVGEATNFRDRADHLIAHLEERVDAVRARTEQVTACPDVVLLEWIDPLFCCGHWTPELVAAAGGREVIGVAGQASRRVTWDAVRAADPQVLVIACCGFDVSRTREDLPRLQEYPGWKQLRCVRENRVYVADGNAYFSRPGPRLADSLERLAVTLHPDLADLDAAPFELAELSHT